MNRQESSDELRLVAVNGMLGYGYEAASLKNSVAAKPHLFGVDAGSSDDRDVSGAQQHGPLMDLEVP